MKLIGNILTAILSQVVALILTLKLWLSFCLGSQSQRTSQHAKRPSSRSPHESPSMNKQIGEGNTVTCIIFPAIEVDGLRVKGLSIFHKNLAKVIQQDVRLASSLVCLLQMWFVQ